MKTIALALNIQEIQNKLSDPAMGKKYPGAGFVRHLVKLAEELGYIVKGAKQALSDVAYGDRDPKNVIVIQEEFNADGLRLIELGAKAQIVFCMESPMYAPHFYDQIPYFKKVFTYQLLFGDLGTHPLYFPSYDKEVLGIYNKQDSFDLGDRVNQSKDICMISSNKQYWSFPAYPNSPSWCMAIENELHTARLLAIRDNPHLDLYGPGWGRLENIPTHFSDIIPIIKSQWKGPVEDKLATLSKYKRCIAYENVNMKGYRTEKTIECLVTNTIPISNHPDSGKWDEKYQLLERHSNETFAKQMMELVG